MRRGDGKFVFSHVDRKRSGNKVIEPIVWVSWFSGYCVKLVHQSVSRERGEATLQVVFLHLLGTVCHFDDFPDDIGGVFFF
jgi:hypothetical protein